MPKVLVINGPNRNLLGSREPEIYGATTLADVEAGLRAQAEAIGVELSCFQSNHEGAIVDRIHAARGEDVAWILINPGAYTHTSVAILDALKAVGIPAVEVHISDVDSREAFRQISYAGMACVNTIKGQGLDGYRQAIKFLLVYQR